MLDPPNRGCNLLKHFQVPDDIAVRVNVDSLRAVTERIFMKCGVPELGAVAQLGERVVRNDEVGGSNPPSSTNSILEFRRKNGPNHQ